MHRECSEVVPVGQRSRLTLLIVSAFAALTALLVVLAWVFWGTFFGDSLDEAVPQEGDTVTPQPLQLPPMPELTEEILVDEEPLIEAYEGPWRGRSRRSTRTPRREPTGWRAGRVESVETPLGEVSLPPAVWGERERDAARNHHYGAQSLRSSGPRNDTGDAQFTRFDLERDNQQPQADEAADNQDNLNRLRNVIENHRNHERSTVRLENFSDVPYQVQAGPFGREADAQRAQRHLAQTYEMGTHRRIIDNEAQVRADTPLPLDRAQTVVSDLTSEGADAGLEAMQLPNDNAFADYRHHEGFDDRRRWRHGPESMRHGHND